MNQILVEVVEGMDEPVWIDRVEPYVQKVLGCMGIDGWEVSILFCDDPFMRQLNKDYRKVDAPTDILSFENGDPYTDADGKTWTAAGDIVLSVPTFTANAAEFDVPVNEELKRLLIHGLLHLSGRDHGEAHITKNRAFEGGSGEDQAMLREQEELLARFGDETLID